MPNLKRFELLILLLMIYFASSHCTRGINLQPIQFQHHQRYAKVFATLGVKCRCCDGAAGSGEGKCRSKWEGSCSKLHCLPWKYHGV